MSVIDLSGLSNKTLDEIVDAIMRSCPDLEEGGNIDEWWDEYDRQYDAIQEEKSRRRKVEEKRQKKLEKRKERRLAAGGTWS